MPESTRKPMLSRALIVGAVTALALPLLTAPTATALSSSDIKLSSLAVNQGSKIGVEVNYLYGSKRCKMTLSGPSRKVKKKTVRVRNSTAKTRISTAGLPVGNYVVRVNCGKGERASSSSFSIVPKGEPREATCDVADYGFSEGPAGDTTVGFIVANRSSALTADSVKAAIQFLDAAGNTLASTTEYLMDIGPQAMVPSGTSADAIGVSSVRVAVVCESSNEPTNPRLRGQATYIEARNSSIYPVRFGGTIPNTTGVTISSSSGIDFVSRNAAGQITGGGSTYPEAFIPPNTTGTWETIDYMTPNNVASVEWVMNVTEE